MGQSTSNAMQSEWAVVELPSHGSIRGVLLTDAQTGQAKTQRFAGVPYAQPPTGPLRWRRPQRLSADFRYDTHGRHFEQLGNVCPQPITYLAHAGFDVPPQPAPYKKSEDCLQLNLWVPVDHSGQRRQPPPGRTGLPVLFFIHGGWLQIGNPHLDVNKDPSDLIASAGLNCIVVSPGYRLNAFGFLAHDALRDEDKDALTGNYGFWDQRLALEWVYDNIAHFGGDRESITVGGLSAGAHSAHSQLLHEYDLCQQDASYRSIIKRLFLQSNAVASPSKRVEETAEQLDELCQALKIALDLTPKEKLAKLRQIGDVELAAAVANLQMHTFRAVRDDMANAFVRSSWTTCMADGSFGRWCEERAITVLMGEVDKEEKVYEVVNAPHDRESFVLQLTNYYPSELVEALMPLYDLKPSGKKQETTTSPASTQRQQQQQPADNSAPTASTEDEVADLYSIFSIGRTASKAEIRAAYLGLVRQHHPDKAQQSDNSLLAAGQSSSALIRQLNTAYAILSDDVTRRAYDRALEAEISQAEKAKHMGGGADGQVRISDTLDLDNFQALRIGSNDDDSDSDSDDDERDVTFVHPCRCGHDYRISDSQISQGVELVACNGCSEVVRVTWFDHDDPPTAAVDNITTPTSPQEWARLFGQICADNQVYLTTRTLIHDLIKGGFAPHAILRYRCDFRAPIFDTFVPKDVGVSHSFDDMVWWYSLGTGGWTDQQLKRVRKWLEPYCRFLEGPVQGDEVREWSEKLALSWYGQEYDVDTVQHASWIRTLKADATIEVVKIDERATQKEALVEAMRKVGESVVST